MQIHDATSVAKTSFTRIACAGPEPCNTLAFVRCEMPLYGDHFYPTSGVVRVGVKFLTQFRLDGFRQSELEWYSRHTVVSATAGLHQLGPSDGDFWRCGVETVTPFLSPEGALGFVIGLALRIKGGEIGFGFTVSAWVLCYEPKAVMPPSGNPGQGIGLWSEVMTARLSGLVMPRHRQARKARQGKPDTSEDR